MADPQTVIRFAKLVKAISLEHGFAPRIREGVGQLTIATREVSLPLVAPSPYVDSHNPSSALTSSQNISRTLQPRSVLPSLRRVRLPRPTDHLQRSSRAEVHREEGGLDHVVIV